jgi:hypothetical protein
MALSALNKKLNLTGCISLLALVAGAYAARLPGKVPGTSGLVPSGLLEWLSVAVLASSGVYSVWLLLRHLRPLGFSGLSVMAGIFAASVPCAAIAVLLLYYGFVYA